MSYYYGKIKLALFITAILFSSKAYCDYRLVIPLASKHIVYTGDYKYHEKNAGLGFEYKFNSATIGYVFSENSYDSYSNYIYILTKRYNGFGAGFLVADNYPKYTEVYGYDSYLTTPIFYYQYKWIRIVTTYPIAKVARKEQVNVADIVNLQLTINF